MQVRSVGGAGVAVVVLAVLAGCGSNSPAEVIIKPGISAIDESRALACNSDLQTLQMAIESYTLLNAGPPTAESDLVPDWLTGESELYDVVEGRVVGAAGSGCTPAPTAAPAASTSP